MAHQQDLYRYIFLMVLDPHDANDILQETSVALFRKQSQYDPTRPFLAWAKRFARLEVMQFRKKTRRHPVLLEDDVIELIAPETDRISSGDRLEALEVCLKRLPERGRHILRCRYKFGMSADEIGDEIDRSRLAVYRQLTRLRKALHECIQDRLAGGAH